MFKYIVNPPRNVLEKQRTRTESSAKGQFPVQMVLYVSQASK